MDWRWTGLVAMMCKATPFEKLACTIDTGTVAVRHVSGSHHIGRSLLPIIMSSFLVLPRARAGRRVRDGCKCYGERRDPCAELFRTVSPIHCGATINRRALVQAYVSRGCKHEDVLYGLFAPPL